MKIHRKLVTSILKTFHHFNRSSADNKHRTRSHDLWRVTGNVSILSRFHLLSTRNRLIEIEIETGLLYLIFLISFIVCRTCSPRIARISRSKSASQCWREKCKKKKKKKIGSCSAVYFFHRHLLGIEKP